MGTRDAGCGLRFSVRDAAILAGAGLTALLARDLPGQPGILVLVVVGHFFLFCNVIRLRRRFELIWAAAFVTLAVAMSLTGRLRWPTVVLGVMPITAALIVAEVRSLRYHGVWCRRPPRPPEAPRG
ncbi:MAG TPA: hypothetical protein VGQ83_43325 [Polyangia bacterium]|jgi:hypothetical protein